MKTSELQRVRELQSAGQTVWGIVLLVLACLVFAVAMGGTATDGGRFLGLAFAVCLAGSGLKQMVCDVYYNDELPRDPWARTVRGPDTRNYRPFR